MVEGRVKYFYAFKLNTRTQKQKNIAENAN